VKEAAAELTRPPVAPALAVPFETGPQLPATYEPLERVYLTDDVSRTLFEEYAAHRASERGEEETGWVLLGVRDSAEATILATLPAGADRDAGEAHVRFNSAAQALGYRMIWPLERRLKMLGVVHTHPGSLRHPSRGDFKGDRGWVPQLPGGEGIFGIGTADADSTTAGLPVASAPRPHMQCLGELRFTWYTLAAGEKRYREAPIALTNGPHLAKPLRAVWSAIEAHAIRLDRLARQQSRVRFEIASGRSGPALAVTVGMAEPGQAVRVVVDGKEVRYYWEAGGEVFHAPLPDTPPDQGVYLLMAELAGRGEPDPE
jgi:proteasome lid subunit RPN8/RPN11